MKHWGGLMNNSNSHLNAEVGIVLEQQEAEGSTPQQLVQPGQQIKMLGGV